jgi:hypothetical protein
MAAGCRTSGVGVASQDLALDDGGISAGELGPWRNERYVINTVSKQQGNLRFVVSR